jgi:hypothetical protein
VSVKPKARRACAAARIETTLPAEAVSSTAGRARVVDPGRGPWAYRTQPVADDDTATGAVPRITINDIFQARAHGRGVSVYRQDRH